MANEKLDTVFLDRDGVINVNIPKAYVLDGSMLHLLPGVPQAVRQLNEAGIRVIVISNQQGVGKGLMPEAALRNIDEKLRTELDKSAGAKIDRIYYCLHLAEDQCDCRKPKGGQLLRAASDYEIDLDRSMFVGDSPTDIEAAHAGGLRHAALVMCGATSSFVPHEWAADPDSIHKDLESCVTWLLRRNWTDKDE